MLERCIATHAPQTHAHPPSLLNPCLYPDPTHEKPIPVVWVRVLHGSGLGWPKNPGVTRANLYIFSLSFNNSVKPEIYLIEPNY